MHACGGVSRRFQVVPEGSRALQGSPGSPGASNGLQGLQEPPEPPKGVGGFLKGSERLDASANIPKAIF